MKYALLTLSVLALVSCKARQFNEASTKTNSANEVCGVITQKSNEFFLDFGEMDAPRKVEPQDGATINTLEGNIGKTACIQTVGAGPIILKSVANIRITSSQQTSVSKVCGTLVKKSNSVFLDFGEMDAAREVEPQDGATGNFLNANIGRRVCFNAGGPGPLLFKSVAEATVRLCGVIAKRSANSFFLALGEGDASRDIEPQDGATSNFLETNQRKTACFNATGFDSIFFKSVAEAQIQK